jgi:putative hydrolase of the HAD superfamily
VHTIRAITLDLDDTLWEIHPVIRRAEKRLYAWLGEHTPRITALYTPGDLRVVRDNVLREFADQAHDLTFLRRIVLEQVGARAGYNNDFISDAFDVFNKARNDVEIFPEVIPALEALRSQFILIALTNGNASLTEIGIDHLFDHFITAAGAGAAKPARKIFDVAVAAAGVTAAQTLHVGDHAELDVEGARAAGLKTAWVNRNGDAWPDALNKPNIEVKHVGELAAELLSTKERLL